jgi:mono/diheme cytochrome c family protein
MLVSSSALPAWTQQTTPSQADVMVREAFTVDAPKETGDSVFRTYCASCHGSGAKGDGPIAQHLRTVPPDLTKLAARNKGTFDAEKVHRKIDGRDPVKGHGGPDMPVWGDAFRQSADGYSKARIDALVEYLRSVQQAVERP